MSEAKKEVTTGGPRRLFRYFNNSIFRKFDGEEIIVDLEFCTKCGCQKDEDHMYSRFCEDCLEDWAEENGVY